MPEQIPAGPAAAMAMPTMVFVCGYLLPVGSYRLDMSQLQPGKCKIIILGSSKRIPKPVRDILEEAAIRNEQGNEWARAFSTTMANINGHMAAVFMELSVSGMAWEKPKPDAEETPPKPAGP